MRIHEVTIENFRGIESKRRFSFCEPGTDAPRRLSVLIGPNMSGKTTVLDALHLVSEVVGNPGAPKLRPNFNPSDPALRPDPSAPVRVGIQFSLHPGEFEAIRELKRALGDPGSELLLETHELHVEWPLARRISDPSAPMLRGRALARDAKAKRLVPESIFDQVGGLLYFDQHRSVELTVPITRTGGEEALREDARSRDVLPWLELQARLDLKWEPQSQGPSTWSRVKERFAELAAPSVIDDMKAFDEGFDLRFRDGDRYYYTPGLSYGQAQMLRFVTNLVAFRATRSVILVDEVELHLHPRWQRKILHFMRRGGGDDNQFIVTTHSESIANYLHPNEVVKLGELDEPG
jgi:energy-coupling factor transporter ATP-binding protein EcfA2